MRGRCEVRGGTTGGRPVSKAPQRRLGHGPGDQVAVLPQRHVHRPVVARRLGELAGAVEGVDDPGAGRAQAGVLVGGVLERLLGEDRVVGPVGRQQLHEQLVGGAVAGVLERLALQPPGPHLEQAAAGLFGQPGGEEVVVGDDLGGGGTGLEGHRVSLVEPPDRGPIRKRAAAWRPARSASAARMVRAKRVTVRGRRSDDTLAPSGSARQRGVLRAAHRRQGWSERSE